MSNGSYFKAIDKSLVTLFSSNTPFIFPDFQREYTWDEQEITELIDDINKDFKDFSKTTSLTNLITFIGNLITININNTQPGNKIYNSFAPNSINQLMPSSLFMVIDGQQRITTFSMIAISLYKLMNDLIEKIKNNCNISFQSLNKLINVIKQEQDELKKLFSVPTSFYTPALSPLCLRQGVDKFVYDATKDESDYKSPICNIQANFIFEITSTTPTSFNPIKGFTPFVIIEKLIQDIGSKHITPTNNLFVNYNNIFSDAIRDCSNQTQEINQLQKLFFWSKYFRENCYVVHIESLTLDLAFDMFQSLNATGSPLSSLEVFKPHVLSKKHTPTNANTSFSTVFDFVSDKKRENTLKRTNEIAITNALVYNGTELSRKFKDQVKYLRDIYDTEFTTLPSSSIVLETIDYVVDFYKDYWTENNISDIVKRLNNDNEAATCLLFLRDSKHIISTSVLTLFYILCNKYSNSYPINDLVNVIKATTAFFVLWRGAFGTTGLPDVYRTFFTAHNIYRFNYKNQKHPTLNNLKNYFKAKLKQKNISLPTSSSSSQAHQQTNWITLSNRLSYQENIQLCRFCLFVYFNQQIADTDPITKCTNGLMTQATSGVTTYLEPNKWESKDLKEIEHVAPQTQTTDSSGGTSWDSKIYEKNLQHDIGNLLLLPKAINISVNNKGFQDKKSYYEIIADKSMQNRETQISGGNATNITGKTANLLLNATYISGLEPFTNLPSTFNWNLNFIQLRGEQIRNVVFNRLWDWLK